MFVVRDNQNIKMHTLDQFKKIINASSNIFRMMTRENQQLAVMHLEETLLALKKTLAAEDGELKNFQSNDISGVLPSSPAEDAPQEDQEEMDTTPDIGSDNLTCSPGAENQQEVSSAQVTCTDVEMNEAVHNGEAADSVKLEDTSYQGTHPSDHLYVSPAQNLTEQEKGATVLILQKRTTRKTSRTAAVENYIDELKTKRQRGRPKKHLDTPPKTLLKDFPEKEKSFESSDRDVGNGYQVIKSEVTDGSPGDVIQLTHSKHLPDDGISISLGDQTRTESHREKCTCPICHKVMTNTSNLEVHMRSHSGERPFQCSKCSMKFTTKGNLVRHERSHEGIKPFECSHCHKCFAEKRTLQTHERCHTGEKPYKCRFCDKCFVQQSTLSTHMKLHQGIKNHMCDTCGACFTQKFQLTVHKLRHQNVRQHECKVCGKTFVAKGDMQRHTRIHTDDKPFLCSVCPKAFRRPAYLQAHMEQHKDTWSHPCTRCGAEFKSRASLRQHMRKVCCGGNTGRSKSDAVQNEADAVEETKETETSVDNVKYVYCVGDNKGEIPLSVIESIHEGAGDTQYFLSEVDTVHYIPEGEEGDANVYTEEVQHYSIVDTGEVSEGQQTQTLVLEGSAEEMNAGVNTVVGHTGSLQAGELVNHLLAGQQEVITEHAQCEAQSGRQLEVTNADGNSVIIIPVMAANESV